MASQNVRRAQAGSRQNQRRLAHTTAIAPATGTSRTCWDRREWTLVASTPHDGHPGGTVEAITKGFGNFPEAHSTDTLLARFDFRDLTLREACSRC